MQTESVEKRWEHPLKQTHKNTFLIHAFLRVCRCVFDFGFAAYLEHRRVQGALIRRELAVDRERARDVWRHRARSQRRATLPVRSHKPRTTVLAEMCLISGGLVRCAHAARLEHRGLASTTDIAASLQDLGHVGTGGIAVFFSNEYRRHSSKHGRVVSASSTGGISVVPIV